MAGLEFECFADIISGKDDITLNIIHYMLDTEYFDIWIFFRTYTFKSRNLSIASLILMMGFSR